MIPVASVRGKASQIVNVTIAAGAVQPIKATGRYVYIVSGPSGIKLRLQDEAFIDANQGTSIECEDGSHFEWLEIQNNNAAATTVKVYIGFAKYEERGLTILEPETETVGLGIASIAATTTQSVAASITGTRQRRKAVVISNEDPSSALEVLDSTGARFGTVWPQTTQIYHVTDTIGVRNGTGVAITCHIGQIYWLRPS